MAEVVYRIGSGSSGGLSRRLAAAGGWRTRARVVRCEHSTTDRGSPGGAPNHGPTEQQVMRARRLRIGFGGGSARCGCRRGRSGPLAFYTSYTA